MSEFRRPEGLTDYNTTPSYTQYTNAKPKKSNTTLILILRMLLSLLVGLTSGIAGGWIAARKYASEQSAVVYHQTDSQSVSPAANMNSNSAAMTIADVATKASPSVVEITYTGTVQTYGFFGGTYQSQGAGSGVIISENGYIVTNNHVVEDGESFTVTLFDGREFEATLIGKDQKSDIAVLKIEAENLTPATIGDSSKIQTGDTAIVIGNPLGTLGGTVTDGIISATSREIVINNQPMNLIQTDAAINSGNSGGGLFDGSGNLIGIVNAKDSGTTSSGALIEGLGFAIPVNTAMEVAEELITNGKVTNRATLGVYLQEVSSDYGGYTAGLYITDIISGSGAEAAGLRSYDRIVSADGTEISTYAELSQILRDKKVGDTLELVIERDKQTMNFTVTLTGTLE
ncbi:MAG: trypsin-like peptidase domain-containing protein [Solobacterium sp.]|nr:trypsin-like peptidase domain-containing protein [Solobacterium sp.]